MVADAGANAVYLSEDVTAFATARVERLRTKLDVDVQTFPGVTVVAPGELTTGSGGAYQRFTPYWRAWTQWRHRMPAGVPDSVRCPSDLRIGSSPTLPGLVEGTPSARLPLGGEHVGRWLLERWLADGVVSYDEGHDDLAGDRTSRLSPYLHRGCVSAAEIVARADRRRSGVDAFGAVMVAADLGRALLLLVMAIPGLPLVAIWALLFVIRLLDSPFNSGYISTMSVVLPGERLVKGSAVTQLVNHVSYTVGYAAGGAIGALTGLSVVLVCNAATFALSGLVILLGVLSRPATASADSSPSWLGSTRAAIRYIAAHPRLRVITLFPFPIATTLVSETLAAPYAAQIGHAPAVAGLLMGAGDDARHPGRRHPDIRTRRPARVVIHGHRGLRSDRHGHGDRPQRRMGAGADPTT